MPVNEIIWEGVYNSFAEAGGDLDAFDSDIWLNKQKSRIQSALDSYNKKTSVSKDYPLPLVVSMALVHQKTLSVLDFGGGMGKQYIDVIGKVPGATQKLNYYVLDGEASISNRPKSLDQFKKLHFTSTFTDINTNIDIIHIGSTLQYIEDWQGLLLTLNDTFNPQYFVFSDLLAGDIPTFVSHQIFYEKRIPHLFLNWPLFEKFIITLGFSLVFHSKFAHNILDQEAVMPNFNLPESHRIDRGRHAVFMAQ